MTTAFQDALNKIKQQSQILENADERAVELGVVLPMLRSAGWDTEELTEVYPQKGFSDSNDKVDYSLQINGEDLVFIEVKRWSHKLNDGDRGQLLKYCEAADPTPPLAALTNGRQWCLYLHPTKSHPELRQFLVLNITPDETEIADDVEMVEQRFKQFLSRDSVASIGKPVYAARQLWRKVLQDEGVMAKLTKDWNKLASSRKEQEKILSLFAQSYEIDAEQEQIKDFLISSTPLFNRAQFNDKQGPQILPKPRGFTFCAKGKESGETITFKKSWNNYVHELSTLVHERHPNEFADKVLTMPKSRFHRITETPSEGYRQIANSDIYFQLFGHAESLKNLGYELLKLFCYSEDTLTIHYD